MNKILFWQYCLPILGLEEMEPIRVGRRLKYIRTEPAKPKARKRHKVRGQLVLRIPDMLIPVQIQGRVAHHAPSADNATLLAEYALHGDKRVRDRLVTQNIRLVRKIAHQLHAKTGHPYEDLEQVGCMGLMRAIDRFDATTKNQLSSFAVPFIRGEIQHYLRDRGHLIRPKNKRWYYLLGTEIKVRQELGAIATNEAVRQRLGLSPQEWAEFQMFKQNRNLKALDVRLTEDGDTLGSMIADGRSQDTTSLELNLLLGQLDRESRQAVTSVHLQELSQKETAALIGCSGRSLSRLLKQGLEQLRELCA